jgi:hypothetical protein
LSPKRLALFFAYAFAALAALLFALRFRAA